MGRKTYVPKMRPKKAAPRPVNYVKRRHSFDRMLKEWYARHKDYYAAFKKRIDDGFINDDPKVLDEIMEVASKFPWASPDNPKKIQDKLTNEPARFSDYTWDKKKDFLNWVTNDLDATISEAISPLSEDNIPAWRKLLVEDGFDDKTTAFQY